MIRTDVVLRPELAGLFTLRAEASPGCLRIEVEDAGGPVGEGWRSGPGDAYRIGHMVSQSLVVQVAPPTVTVMRAPGGGPLR